MKKKALFLFLIAPMLLVGCNTKKQSSSETSSQPEEDTSKGQVTIKMDGMVAKKSYDLTFDCNDADFEASASTQSENIKKLSFAASIVSGSSETALPFYTSMHYDTLFDSLGELGENTVGYVMAHKNIKDSELTTYGAKLNIFTQAKVVLVAKIMDEIFMDNAKRAVYMHMPLTVYALVK